jgi:SAM-dependent methyltransferase
MSETYTYIGGELGLFAHARTWKTYIARKLKPFIHGDVLEVGAGTGNTTRFLHDPEHLQWTCLEPDPELAQILADSLVENDLEDTVHVAVGTIADLPTDRAFDSILYIDVLEHIQDDAQELIMAVSRLRTSGKLIVLAPAHQRLFSEFDRSVGHFRRYDKRSLKGIAPPGLREEALIYLDSMGILASMANRLLLRQSTPTIRQIETWDRFLVPVSRLLDPLLMHKLGKTVTAVWRKL